MKKFCLGFTLIELLLVASIITIIFGIGIAQYMNFNRSQILEQAARGLENNLRMAQMMASSGEKPKGCSVLDGYRVGFFSGGSNPDSYTITAICGGKTVDSGQNFSLPSVVKFSPLPPSFLFKVLSQGTDLNSDLTISLTAFGKVKNIIVTKEGKIE